MKSNNPIAQDQIPGAARTISAGWTQTQPKPKSIGNFSNRPLFDFESESLCAEARQRTGLVDFGDPSIQPALSMLVSSLRREANLHLRGRFLMRSHLRELLETRLHLTELWKAHLKAHETSPLRRPIFITGIPRSGSTFLQQLLAEDPAHRPPEVWEVMFPLPPPQSDRGWTDSRVWRAATRLWWFRRFARGADGVYPVRTRTPQECIAIHSYTFLSDEFLTTCRIPGYESFLRSADLLPVYRWQRRFLQHLEGIPPKRWILKAPDHVYGLEALFSVFPDALIVHTHRDPIAVLPSVVQLTEIIRSVFAHPQEYCELARREAQVLANGISRIIQFRESHPELERQFVDVSYSDLVRNPEVVVQRIYEKFRLPWTQVTSWRVRECARRRSRYSGCRTARGLSDLGLDSSPEAELFDAYCDRFNLPRNRPGAFLARAAS